MTSSVADMSAVGDPSKSRTTETPCPICVMTLSFDDERPRLGVVRWDIVGLGLRMGTAVSFECPNGHSSTDDPALLKAFPSRRFW